MPVVTVLGPVDVQPRFAQVLRNDQTITWKLGEGVAWNPEAGNQAVRFLEETEVYSKWPGSTPEPVGHLAGFPDRRDYEARANALMAPREFRFYHYEVAAIDENTGESFMVRFRCDNEGHGHEWHDPEVVNEPRP